jgi:hypothetical protein
MKKNTKKALSVFLTGMLVFTVSSVAVTAFKNLDKDEEPAIEQEIPYEPIAFNDGWVLKTDLAEEDTVAYFRIPKGFTFTSSAMMISGTTYDELCFKLYDEVYTPTFQGKASTDGLIEDHSVLNFVLSEEMSSSVSGLAEIYYLPLAQEHVTLLENKYAETMGGNLWTDALNPDEVSVTVQVEFTSFGSKCFLESEPKTGNYIDSTSTYGGPTGAFALFKK